MSCAAYHGGTLLHVPNVPSPAYHAVHERHNASIAAHDESCPHRVLQYLGHHLTC